MKHTYEFYVKYRLRLSVKITNDAMMGTFEDMSSKLNVDEMCTYIISYSQKIQ
jgi:hypothetical protein